MSALHELVSLPNSVYRAERLTEYLFLHCFGRSRSKEVARRSFYRAISTHGLGYPLFAKVNFSWDDFLLYLERRQFLEEQTDRIHLTPDGQQRLQYLHRRVQRYLKPARHGRLTKS